ncbi:MAG: hypothetical protein Q4D38_00895 [Planctomycetia bacterium]|nr:hypothetical protein [Planctomycetia bacterium]
MYSKRLNQSKRARSGALTFEWIVITALLVIGVLSGLGALRYELLRSASILPEKVCEISSGIPEDSIKIPEDSIK